MPAFRTVALVFALIVCALACAAPPSTRAPASDVEARSASGPAPISAAGADSLRDAAAAQTAAIPAAPAPTGPSAPAARVSSSTSVALADVPARDGDRAPGASASNPRVKVVNIGLHIGGGPNDAPTKAPFLRAIAARFDDFRRCYEAIGVERASGTFGIDLLVPAGGGHAEASNPRTALPSADFKSCVVSAFESVEFGRPKHGATKLSYALRFDPG